MDEMKIVFICENTMEGIFTAIYEGWLMEKNQVQVEIRTETSQNQELFCRYEMVTTNMEEAIKVARTIRRRLGARTYECICYAAVSVHPEKGTAIFRVLRKALGGGRCVPQIMDDMADLYVNMVSKMYIRVWHEYHRYMGFVRFSEVGGGVLFAKIAPENDILVMLAPHFEDRFPNEHWMIYDEKRHKVLLHEKGKKCAVHTEVQLSEEYGEKLAEAEKYEDLWRVFCKSITIEERRNGKLQQQFLPKKFRPNMTEFKEDAAASGR